MACPAGCGSLDTRGISRSKSTFSQESIMTLGQKTAWVSFKFLIFQALRIFFKEIDKKNNYLQHFLFRPSQWYLPANKHAKVTGITSIEIHTLTRKSSSIRGSSRTRPSKTKRQSSMQSFSNLAFRHHSSASQRAAVINQRIDRDKSIFGKVRIKIPIINNFE